MSGLETNLLKLYAPLMAWVGLGIVLGRKLPTVVPFQLGQFLFWIGVPVSIVVFLRQADLSASIWIAPIVAWIAIALGAGFAWAWIQGQAYLARLAARYLEAPVGLSWWQRRLATSAQPIPQRPSQGSFLLSAMIGNTGYLGYPVILALVGPQYFGWAIFYDTIGSTLGAYGLGVLLAARFGMATQNPWRLIAATLKNPALWSFGFGLGFRRIPFSEPVEGSLRGAAWGVIALSLLLIGMRLSQLRSWRSMKRAIVSLSIKMLIVPLLVGLGLTWVGFTGPPQLVIVLQVAMPPAFATLVIAEAYNLDRELAVTALAVGSMGLLVMLPIWLWLFAA
ncbi:AEC family transporter [Oculatella sp. LEGE 06141]|uniref:AEC family transporter n=1 Tax=Oculatella sp. LEGE 06141 TaxID=1828648 RepID=UPI001880795E|nr:AEC family transporter [Oculatella sp. LEGE 06141]MBE9179264.1 AEC family transporter [Oculatella sp. LEGE 06141]